jgi:putative transposase
MARLARHYVPEQPQHVILNGFTGPAFLDEGDYLYFLACLADAARVADLAVHAWVLMPDAVQFLVTPSYESSLAMAMQAIGRRYFLLASQVIDYAPVGNRLVTDPGNYPWSSYTHHIGLRVDNFIKDHPLYRALGNTPIERHQAYRDLGAQPLDEREVDILMRSTLEGWVLGSAAYCEWAAQTANRRLMPLLLRDRPPKVRMTRDFAHES